MGEVVYGGIITVGADGSIVLPEAVRQSLDLHPRDALIFSTEGESIVAMKVKDEEVEYSVEGNE